MMADGTAGAGEVEDRLMRPCTLVFGMPRSGTTWLGKIFDSHPSTLYRHEPDSWRKMDSVPILPVPEDHERLAHEIRKFYVSIVEMAAAKVCAKPPVFRKDYLTPGRHRLFQIGTTLSRAAARIGVELPVWHAPTVSSDGVHLVWKSIESIGRLRLIMMSLPDAKAIHLVRHPCGYIASILRGEARRKFEDNRGASEDYGILEQLLASSVARVHQLSMERLRQMSPFERLAWRWVILNAEAGSVAEDSAKCRTVRYEDLCASPVDRARELFEFAGLEWSGQTESFLRSSTVRDEDSYYGVFKDPALAASKWRGDLQPEAIEQIRRVVENTAPGRLYDHEW